MGKKEYQRIIKPVFDFIAALVMLVTLSPVFLFILILLYFLNNGKPFFFQDRPGKNGNIFKIIKFKTMNDKKDQDGNLLPMSERLTKTGLFLRKTSLDEIPQLLNILKGDMSLVGPRPLLVEYLTMYTSRQMKRHNVKPGVTGWAQVNGRNSVTLKEKLELDLWYVENIGLKVDFIILIKTFIKVVSKSDVADSEAKITAADFTD